MAKSLQKNNETGQKFSMNMSSANASNTNSYHFSGKKKESSHYKDCSFGFNNYTIFVIHLLF